MGNFTHNYLEAGYRPDLDVTLPIGLAIMRDLIRSAVHFCSEVSQYCEPFAVLRGVEASLQQSEIAADLHVFGTWYWPPVNPTDVSRWIQNKTVFMLATDGLIAEYLAAAETHGLSPTTLLARRNSAPYTLTEGMRELRPTGDDRWLIRLLRKHGIRDVLYCPMVRWTFAFWSAQPIKFGPEVRGLIGMTATSAIGRIERLKRFPEMASKRSLTARELEVLTLASTGLTAAQIAIKLEISPKTAKRHFENILRKLSAKNVAHAVAEAIRQGLIV
jgi:DNA-binding CsgD family transcriptional regulator